MANLSNRIKSLRQSANMTQEEFGKKFGIVKSTVSLYESGKSTPNDQIKKQMCDYFHVSLDYLLGLTDKPLVDTEFEWRYPPVLNRLGNILSEYRQKKDLSLEEFSKQLDISSDLYIGIETGRYDPTLELLQKIANETQYNIDYLTGATEHTSVPTNETIELSSQRFPVFMFEGDSHFKARFEELCLQHSISYDNVEKRLGLSQQEFNDLRYNRMPTLSELLKISYAFGVSMDYLIGKTDTRLSSLNKAELDLILNYRQCLDCFKENISQRASELCIESLHEREQETSFVAADEPLKKTGTTNSA